MEKMTTYNDLQTVANMLQECIKKTSSTKQAGGGYSEPVVKNSKIAYALAKTMVGVEKEIKKVYKQESEIYMKFVVKDKNGKPAIKEGKELDYGNEENETALEQALSEFREKYEFNFLPHHIMIDELSNVNDASFITTLLSLDMVEQSEQ